MGTIYELHCMKCKQYVHLAKCSTFIILTQSERPPIFNEGGEEKDLFGRSEPYFKGSYYVAKGLWFTWNHRQHGDELILLEDGEVQYKGTWYDGNDINQLTGNNIEMFSDLEEFQKYYKKAWKDYEDARTLTHK